MKNLRNKLKRISALFGVVLLLSSLQISTVKANNLTVDEYQIQQQQNSINTVTPYVNPNGYTGTYPYSYSQPYYYPYNTCDESWMVTAYLFITVLVILVLLGFAMGFSSGSNRR